jgi:hypothetical protein
MYSLEIYKNIYLSVSLWFFKSSMGWINQGVTFLIVPPKDGFLICGHVSYGHEVLFHYQKYPQPCIKFHYYDSI